MPITGAFINGRPYLSCKVIVPRLYLVNELHFLMDTGTNSTVVMPSDGDNLGVDYRQLRGDVSSTGVGGIAHSFVEPALLAFTDAGRVEFTYQLDIRFMKDTVISRQLPSLLGRDVLNHWSIIYDSNVDVLEATVRSARGTRDEVVG